MWKKWLRGIFYVNGELSRTSLFLFSFFLAAMFGIVKVMTGYMELTTNLKDLLEFLVGIVIVGKVGDNTIERIWNTPPVKKNPEGGEGSG